MSPQNMTKGRSKHFAGLLSCFAPHPYKIYPLINGEQKGKQKHLVNMFDSVVVSL